MSIINGKFRVYNFRWGQVFFYVPSQYAFKYKIARKKRWARHWGYSRIVKKVHRDVYRPWGKINTKWDWRKGVRWAKR